MLITSHAGRAIAATPQEGDYPLGAECAAEGFDYGTAFRLFQRPRTGQGGFSPGSRVRSYTTSVSDIARRDAQRDVERAFKERSLGAI
jgi:hypothetical protein